MRHPEDKLIRACLAALARRVGVGLVVTQEELEREITGGTKLRFAFDDDADCVRITVPEVSL